MWGEPRRVGASGILIQKRKCRRVRVEEVARNEEIVASCEDGEVDHGWNRVVIL